MSFGGDTITFVSVTETGDPDGMGQRPVTRVNVDVPGCMHRPLSAEETPEWLTQIATEIWQTTAPPGAATLAANSTGEMKVDGITYRIIGGAQPFKDFTPNAFLVKFLSKRLED